MTIHRVRLQNFKKHRDLSVDFSPGLVGIIGQNFSGKSTLLKAVMFCLFGTTSTGHKADRIPTRGAADPTSVDIDIDIPVHGRVHIIRTLKGAKVFAMDGTLLASGTTPCVKLLEEAYGMSAPDLQTLMYSRQGQSQLFLEMGASILQQMVERLAKSDLVDKVLGMVGKDLTSAEGRIAGLGTPEDAGALQEALQEAIKKFKSLEISLEEVTVDIRQAQELETLSRRQLDEAVQTIEKRKRIGAQLTALVQQAHDLELEVKEQETTLEGISPNLEQDAETDKANMAGLQTTCMTWNQKVSTAESLIDRIGKRKTSLEHYAAEMKQSGEVRDSLMGAEQEVEQLEEEYRALKILAVQATTEMNAARKAVSDGVCKTCQRPFSEEEQVEAVKRFEIAADEQEKAHQRYSDSLTPLKLAEEKLAKLKTLYKPGAEQAYLEVKTQLEDAEADLANVMQGFGSLLALKADAKLAKEYLEVTTKNWQEKVAKIAERDRITHHLNLSWKQLHSSNLSIVKLEADLAALPEVYLNQATVEQTLFGAIEHKNSLLDFEKRLIIYKAQAEADIRTLTASLERSQKVAMELQTLQSDIDKRKRLQSWLRKSRAELMTELWDNMLAYASHLISSTTDGLLAQVFREEGELFVVEEGYKMAVSELSGFQRSLVGLAIRIAMSRVFYGEDHFLLLDEPTSDANEESAARIAGMLQGLGSQVIYVTHREGDSVNAGTVISL